ncbi:aldehyde ferredoxin oxidoreductase C-terminal domain-containing protein [Paradesulfitobacterium ferrireducens]|uniref:aldehyde ferredoxin oxidoreductase C-terminal domain-containing protein n=1 Tax=Paradesulfitobacterium ferrireducens TaxID=2816476 RepID=UPI001A8FF39A|nr:aldehyde ferredoxin oxidoreductase C-terminal domain-containing protein [Paradesulfitobacterium ferrireducens]
MAKLIRVNMKTQEITERPLPESYIGLGGRGLTSKIIFDEVSPDCDPLGPLNKLIMAPGILGGTSLSSSGRLSVGAKSPLTGGIKESNAGGNAAAKLARLDIAAIIVEQSADNGNIFVLVIANEEIKLVQANDLKGLGNYELVKKLRGQYGDKTGIISIGTAGELGLAAAGVAVTDMDGEPSRFSGRGGLGAVMGSKGLKAVIINDEGRSKLPLEDEEKFTKLAREIHNELKENATIQGYGKYGTAGLLDLVNELGALPTKNFSQGRFDGAAKINGEALYQTITQRGGKGKPTHACMPGCLIKCSNVYPDENGEVVVAPVEYETIGLLGSNCEIDDLDAIARLNYLCNDQGIDTIEIGAALGVAMEAGVIPFGDAEKAEKAVAEISQGTVLGRLLGNGAVLTGRILGISRVPAVKGQAMPSYDPRGVKGNGVTYATSPMGADHTAGNNVRGKNQHLAEGQIENSFNAQVLMAAYDSLGLCIFLGAVLNQKLDYVRQLVAAKIGSELPGDYMTRLGKSVLQVELGFNAKAGFTSAQDRLPSYMSSERLSPNNLVFDVPYEEIDLRLDNLRRDS